MISFNFGVEVIKRKLEEPTKTANTNYNKILSDLKKLELADAEFETMSYDFSRYEPQVGNKQVFKGYKTSINLKLLTSDLKRVAEIFQLSNKLPKNTFFAPKSFVSRVLFQKTYNSCLAQALQNVKEKADILIKSQNRKLGDIISIGEGNKSNQPHLLIFQLALRQTKRNKKFHFL